MVDGLDFQLHRAHLPARHDGHPGLERHPASLPFQRPLGPAQGEAMGNLDDAHFPAYTMSAAAALLGVQPGFLRGLGEAGLLAPARSTGGHRRYSRMDLEIAARAREVVDEGMSLAAACRIVQLEVELARTRAALSEASERLSATSEGALT
jgi:MerR family transcriptional regulator/heat shock protein HspR